ncbi:MAG: hypothetical protein ACPGPD_04595 [Pseudomonadales bacterium]
MDIILIAALLLVVIVIAIIFFERQRRLHIRNRAIAESLNTIRLSADESRLRGLPSEIDIDPEFDNLRHLAVNCPAQAAQKIRDLEDRWHEVQRRFSEYNAQDHVATLQSSVTMLQTDQLVDEIFELCKDVENSLGDRRATF